LSPSETGQWTTHSQVTTYVQTIAGLLSLLISFVAAWKISDIRIPLAITAGFIAFMGAVGLALWRTRRRKRPVAFAAAIVLAVVVAGSWAGFGLAQVSVADAPTPPEPTPSPTASISSDPSTPIAASSLCTDRAPAETSSLFLYETASGTDTIVVEKDGSPVSSIDGSAFSAAASRLVHVDADDPTRVAVVVLPTLEVVATTVLDGRVADTTISRDGEKIVVLENVGGDTRLVLWRPSEDTLEVVHDPRPNVWGPSLAPAGDRLAWVQGDESSGEVRVADLATLVIDTVAESGSDPAWSPDGSTIVYSAPYGEGMAVYAVSDQEDEPRRVTSPVQAVDYDPAVLPGCDGVVYARSQGGTVDLWETRDGGLDEVLRDLPGPQSRPAFATG